MVFDEDDDFNALAMSWAPVVRRAGGLEKLVLIAIAYDYVHGVGNTISIREIVKRTGMARSTVMKALKSLEDKGLIKRIRTRCEKSGAQATRYLLPIDGIYYTIETLDTARKRAVR